MIVHLEKGIKKAFSPEYSKIIMNNYRLYVSIFGYPWDRPSDIDITKIKQIVGPTKDESGNSTCYQATDNPECRHGFSFQIIQNKGIELCSYKKHKNHGK
jgi:hypothetical protein